MRKPMGLHSNQSGFAIIEVLVAVSILAMVLYMLVGIQVDYFRRFHDIANDADELSGLRSIEEDIMKDEKFIVPQPSIASLEADVLVDTALADSFNPPTKVDERCYTQQGAYREDLKDPLCYYTAAYYKTSVLDRRHPATSIFSSIPMARVNIRVRYYEMVQLDNTKPPQKVERNLYLSRLVTNAISY